MVIWEKEEKTVQGQMAGFMLVMAHAFSILEAPFMWNLVHSLLLIFVVASGYRRFHLVMLTAFVFTHAVLFSSWVPGTFFLLCLATFVLAVDLNETSLLRWGLFLGYFFPFFHKLNYDFLNPQVSCAQELLSLSPWLEQFRDVSWLRQILPTIALLFEGSMSIGLLFPWTAPLSLMLAFSLHFIMVLAQIYTLPQIMFVMATGFFQLDSLDKNVAHRFMIVQSLFASFFLLRKVGASLQWSVFSYFPAAISIQTLLNISFCLMMLHFLYVIFRYRLKLRKIDRPKGMFRWAVIIYVVLWGLQNFLGLSTTSSMAMHSNLRTETQGNHLFLGALPPLFDLQKDPVSWEEYLELTKNCPHRLVHGREDLTPLAQWGRAPFGHFNWIPRYEVEKTLTLCRGEKIPLQKFFTLRPYDAPGPNACRK